MIGLFLQRQRAPGAAARIKRIARKLVLDARQYASDLRQRKEVRNHEKNNFGGNRPDPPTLCRRHRMSDHKRS